MKYADYEEIQVTQVPEQVHCLTKGGWKLLEIVSTGEVMSGWQEVADVGGSCPNCNNYHSGNSSQIQGSVVVAKPVFILGLSKDKTVTDLRDDLKRSKEVVDMQETEIKSLQKEKAAESTSKEYHKDENETLRKTITRLEEDVKKKDVLEGHLNKAKKLVGERDWKREVLGEAE